MFNSFKTSLTKLHFLALGIRNQKNILNTKVYTLIRRKINIVGSILFTTGIIKKFYSLVEYF
jgi:hypothetical protein